MPTFPLDAAQLVALFVECILYGIYLVSFGICAYTLWMTRSSSASDLSRRRMITAVTMLLFVFATADVAFGLRHILDAFVYYDGSDGPIGELSDISYWVNVMKGLNYNCQTTIADFVLVYRCFALYGRRWVVISGLIVLWIGGIVSEVFFIYGEFSLHTPSDLSSSRLAVSGSSVIAISLALNLIATAMIVLRIWRVQQETAQYHVSSGGRRGSAAWRAMIIIIESGAIYTCSLLIFFVVFVSKNNAQYVCSDAIVQIIGICFNLIIIRISQNKTQEDSLPTPVIVARKVHEFELECVPATSLNSRQNTDNAPGAAVDTKCVIEMGTICSLCESH